MHVGGRILSLSAAIHSSDVVSGVHSCVCADWETVKCKCLNQSSAYLSPFRPCPSTFNLLTPSCSSLASLSAAVAT